MRLAGITYVLVLGTATCCLLAPSAAAQDSIMDLRPPSGVAGTSPAGGIESLIQEWVNLEVLQIGLLPVFDGSITIASEPEPLEEARELVEEYIEASAYMLVTAALQLGGTEDNPPSVMPLTTLMLGQIGYVNAISIPLEIDPETLYSSIVLDPRFNDLLPDVQTAMIGRYIQQLLLKPNLTTEETNALAVVDNKAFMTSLSELSGIVAGTTDIYSIDWDELKDETVWIRYYDEQLRLVEKTVTDIDYDHRYGVILAPEEEGDPVIRINLSRIEVVEVRSNDATN